MYSISGPIDLRLSSERMNFNVLDPNCSCPTCTQKLTRAYLHHLLQHTPLLCQRFLILHNIQFTIATLSA